MDYPTEGKEVLFSTIALFEVSEKSGQFQLAVHCAVATAIAAHPFLEIAAFGGLD